jgi:TMEM151 family
VGLAFSPLLNLWISTAFDRVLARVLVFAIYLVECELCSTLQYLSNRLSPSAWSDYVQQLQEAEPRIVWDVECYHYKHVWRQNGNHTTTSREKVVTHRARQAYGVGQWKDSTSLDMLERAIQMGDEIVSSTQSTHPFLKVSLAKLFVFTNPVAGERYWLEEAMFREREGRWDLYCDFERTLQLDHFRRKVLVVRTGLSDVAFASPLWFWIASLLGLTVPYRVWFARHCRPAELTITKELEA